MKSNMKILISYSVHDQWVVLQIADELEKNGVALYLDEKSKTSGHRVRSQIKKKLAWCDHYIVLLSESSTHSKWIHDELDAVCRSSKRVVPICLDRSIKSIPKILCDHKIPLKYLNGISGYVREVSHSCSRAYAVSDVIRIPDAPQPPAQLKGRIGEINWTKAQNKFCGKQARITRIIGGDYEAFEIDLDKGKFYWPWVWFNKERQPAHI